MPPVQPTIYAVVFHLFGVKTLAAARCIIVLKWLAVTLCAYNLAVCARRYRLKDPWKLILIFALFVFNQFEWFFQHLMDIWLITLLFSLALRCIAELAEGPPRAWHLFFALFLPITNPALSLAFFVAIVARFGKKREIWILFLALLLPVVGWGVRNKVVLGRAYPIKSNLWFEFYLSNACAPLGHLRTSVIVGHHPFGGDRYTARQIASDGEVKFLDHYRDVSFRLIRDEPGTVLRRIGQRLFYIFVFHHQSHNIVPARTLLGEDDLRVLIKAGLAHQFFPDSPHYWLAVDEPLSEVEKSFDALELREPEKAWESFLQTRTELKQNRREPGYILWGLAYGLLPTLGILVGFLRFGLRSPDFTSAVVLYLVYLTPYILVSYASWYSLMALPVQAWLVWRAFFTNGLTSEA